MGVTDVREFYAFISYKRGCNDEVWAKSLYHHLIGWHIPIEIPDDLRLNMTERIDPIFKDKDNLSGDGGNLDLKLKEALANSRTLVLILSRRMYEAERGKIKNSETPYIFKEVEYFIEELGHSTNDVIIVYIDNDIYNPEILPPSLLNESNINVVNVNDYIKEKDYKKHTAAKVAAGIFHSDKDIFWRYHERILKEQRKRNFVVLFSIVLILGVIFSGFYFSARQSTKTVEAFRLIELSKQAYNKGDVQAAKILSIEAYDKKPSLKEVQENLWKYDIDDYNKPFATIPSGVVISNSGKEIMYLEDNDLVIKDSYTLEDVERINIDMQSLVSRVVYSQDDSKIAIVRYDSIKIYDRNKNDFIYTENSRWLTRGMEPWYDNLTFCNNDNNFLIYYRSDSRIMNFDIANDKISIFNTLDSTPNHLYVVNNEVFVELEDSLGFGLYQYDYVNNAIDTIIRYELPGQTLRDYAINPQTKQSVLVSQDTIYCVNRKQNIIHKTAFNGYIQYSPFSPNGDNVIYHNERHLFVCDTVGLVWSLSMRDIENLYWFSDSTFMCVTKEDIDYINIKNKDVTKYNIKLGENNGPRYYANDSLIITSPLYTPYPFHNGKTKIIHLSKINSTEQRFYTPNGRYVFTHKKEGSSLSGKNKTSCRNTNNDSLLWTLKSYYGENIKPLNKHLVRYGYRNYPPGIDVIDVETGKIISAINGHVAHIPDNRYEPTIINDSLILYTRNDSLYLQNICNNKFVTIGYIPNFYEDNSREECIEEKGIYAMSIYNTLYIIDLSTLSIIKMIDWDNEKYGIKGFKISSDGRYIVCTQASLELGNIIIYDIQQNKTFSYEYPYYIFHTFAITHQNMLVFSDHFAGNIYIYNLVTQQMEKKINVEFMPTNIINLNDKEIILTDYDDNNYVMSKKSWKITGRYKYTGHITIYNKYMKVGNLLIDRERDKIIRRTGETIRYITDSVIVFERSDNYHQEREFLVPMENIQQFRDRLKAQVGNRQLSEWEMQRFAKEE